ncbi:translation initiation factor IF-2, mitochondrial [Ceratina calcarata]|uniref:Translation initiation factor IF-2, mitochondrial n=1 Tax=Ceratina calcarata TaxID=156304 RepID=A0AAJ7J3K6_9HYME|nr:translation initiation factor IF-2, mitochondrial [Ceratina calcarata]
MAGCMCMVRTYVQYSQYSLSKSKPLIDIIWREQCVNYLLQTLRASQMQHQFYHTTPAFFKKRKTTSEKKLVFVEEMLYDGTLKRITKKSVPAVDMWVGMTVTELAESAKRNVQDVIEVLYRVQRTDSFQKDSVLSDIGTLTAAAKRLGYKSNFISKHVEKDVKFKDITRRPPPDESKLVPRHPVVTIMGHVDHGKTTLLDALRHSSIVDSEFGGITQHIGAFDVTLESGERVTFLDTPGHAAFTAMRYRGAHVTDIVVLVVAADDGVKDQTLQSIRMAKNAKVPIIVAINKIDKPNANIKKTQEELAEQDIVVEELGGDVQCVKISALKGTNLKELTEAIIVQAEIMNLRGDPSGLVEGVAIECSSHIHRGKLVTALIQRGTLKKGSLLVSGIAFAKVRAMFNESGHPVLEAKPSEAIQIIGWRSLPDVGDEILEVENDRVLQEVLKFREKKRDEALAIKHQNVADKKHNEHLIDYKRILGIRRLFGRNREVIKMAEEKLAEDKKKRTIVDTTPAINVILKGDVAGSVEALLDIFDTYTSDEICRLNIVHYGVGHVTESDIELAETFNAIVYAFNVNINKQIEAEVKKKDVTVCFYNIVYKLIDDVKKRINSVLPEVEVEEILGEARVLQQFEIKDRNKRVTVAGCRCTSGILLRSEMYHVIRKNEKIYTGKLVSMRHLKEEMPSIEINLECGLRFEDPISFQPGDVVVCFTLNRQKQTIDWDPGF